MADEETEQEVRRALDVLQSMIDISADRLEGLRTQCATSAELTQQEIRTLEGKLIKLFSKQLVTKAKLDGDALASDFKHVPSLEQWLQVVGLCPESVKCICQKVSTIEALQEKSEHELRVILTDHYSRQEEVRRLSRALHNLKKYTDILLQGGQSADSSNEPALYWDSWEQARRSGGSGGGPGGGGGGGGGGAGGAAKGAGGVGGGAGGLSASPRPPRASRAARASLPCAGGEDDDADDGCTCSCVAHGTPASSAHSSHAASPSLPSLAGSPTRLSAPAPLSPPPPLQLPLNHHPHHLHYPPLHHHHHHHQHHHLHHHHFQQQPPPSPPPPPPPPASSSSQYTPPSTPPVGKGKGAADRVKFPTTPPPCRRHQTGLAGAALLPETYPLTKSKSHESQLGNRVEGSEGGSGSSDQGGGPATRVMRGRLPTEPGPNCTSDLGQMSPQLSSPIKSPPYCAPLDGEDRVTLQVPKSPRTPTTISRGMGHMIAHRFKKEFKLVATCDYCDKQMLFGTGLKCKECKYKCHRECEPKVPPSCGLPRDFLDYFSKSLVQPEVFLPNQSPSMGRGPGSSSAVTIWSERSKHRGHSQLPIITPFPTGPDSSSNTSSCNSSAPSSPALGALGAAHTPQPVLKPQFHFPEVERGVTLETHPLPAVQAPDEVADTHRSNDSDRTVSGSGSASTDSERTPIRVDSQDSQVSDGEAVERPWPRQNSLSMREWDIPFDELKIGEPIGTGRFGTVYRGNWHGDVAIKLLNMDNLDDEKTLEAFKLEVATFRKTRHENLVLFMGACMKLPRLAIVTSMCKGMTLYTHIHLRKDKFNMNKTTIVAQQISQGMGYLHARGIVHKDLKSKNIFLENGKVVITDFGLFSVTKLCFGNRRGNGLSIPPGWLCYLSPEILRSLRVRQKHDEEELPFTQASDVYAFGTVWYELLCGEWPFKAQPPEAIIWQVGKGMKQSLANLQASRDVKDILMLCWSYRPADRPEFSQLLKTLEKLPKKRLARSPSHPIHLSRSAESVF